MRVGIFGSIALVGVLSFLQPFPTRAPLAVAPSPEATFVILSPSPVVAPSPSPTPSPSLPVVLTPSPSQTSSLVTSPSAVLMVPFMPQAPNGDWSDPHFQDGCEEAAIIMAMHWVRDQALVVSEAAHEIKALSGYQVERFGTFRDLSVHDMKNLVEEYYHYDNAEVRQGVSVNDIKAEIDAGNIVIVPADGRSLKNPYFTPPGPLHHIVLIRGYDDTTGEFITNDPGTRRGEGFRYSYSRLYEAIREYPTGDHLPTLSIIKSMMVVRPWDTLASRDTDFAPLDRE